MKRLQKMSVKNIPNMLILAYLILALAFSVVLPFHAVDWFEQPFLGRFIYSSEQISDVSSVENPSKWPLQNMGVGSSFQISEIDGHKIAEVGNLNAYLRDFSTGQSFTLKLIENQGKAITVTIQSVAFPFLDQLSFFYFPYIIGLIFIIFALILFILHRQPESGQSLSIFAASIGLGLICFFDLFSSQRFTGLFPVWLVLSGASFFEFSFVFPSNEKILEKAPWLRFVGYVAGLILLLVTQLFNRNENILTRMRPIFLFVGIVVAISLIKIWVRRLQKGLIVEKQQSWLLFIGGIVSFGPITYWLVGTSINPALSYTPIYIFPMILFPFIAGYTIQRFRVFHTDYVVSRSVLYTLVSVIIIVSYALIVAGLSEMLSGFFKIYQPLITGGLLVILALIFDPLRNYLKQSLDKIFFRGAKAYQDRLGSFTGRLTEVSNISEVAETLKKNIDESLHPGTMHIFLFEPMNSQYSAIRQNGQSTSDIRFLQSNSLIQALSEKHTPRFLEDILDDPSVSKTEKTRILLLNSQLFIPLPGQNQLIGWVALGERLSGEVYSLRDINFIETLCDQSAMAIERMQVIENMQKRVNEMNALARIAQGVNVTLSLDDIFELIYAQTTQIIPSSDFSMMLCEAGSEDLELVFYIEDNRRNFDEEKKLVIQGQALEYSVLKLRKPFLSNHYVQECEVQNIINLNPEIETWMGVPLNTGAETIGVLSLANRSADISFSVDQMNLLQAIADQAAGAIEKARLLDDSEQRALQLTSLSEVTRQLTSTLDFEPLLNNIVISASDLLNCEAGCLLLIDEQTSEMLFSAVHGAIAPNLIGKRFSNEVGVAGQAVQTRDAVVDNLAAHATEWLVKPDENTGFIFRSLLAVPMIYKDRAVGVIEVINRRDGSPFVKIDEELLLAFASQAAVALENARLYTLTDQALADKVEQLSVLQQIDRELNTSLDTKKALEITLEWAIRQTKAEAGLVGIVENGTFEIIASKEANPTGLNSEKIVEELSTYQLDQVIKKGKARRLGLDAGIPMVFHSSVCQVVVPILRETQTTGLILLESRDPSLCDDDNLNFMMRLSDHASIAIANAQLYAAVQAANVAKSEFVSLVAHELKNPMTSIKGYTDLIAAGAVGEVNEAQANFLSTIRSNIDRMNTLISDLNDLSKIEAGRMRLEYRSFDLKKLVDDIVRSTHRQLEDKSQELIVNLDQELPQVWADASRVSQVLINLVSNANKYTEKGGKIYLEAKPSKNQWDANGPTEVVHIVIKDNGIGISSEDQAKIFQKFFRSEDPKTREVAGTGLGLSITRSLVEMQGGKIWFESEYRKGTAFHFTLPISTNY